MNFNQYRNVKDLQIKLLESLNLIENNTYIIKVNLDPDFDIINFDRHNDKDYYFYNSLKFQENHNFIIDCSFLKQFILTGDTLDDIEENEDILFTDKENVDLSIKELEDLNEDLLDTYSFPLDFDGFKLNAIKVKFINNTEKKIYYEGSYFAASVNIYPDFWDMFSYVNMTSIKKNHQQFYKDLIGESYILKLEGNLKLSLFTLYSALESFVNYKLNDNTEIRLKDGIAKLFQIENNCKDLTKNNLYSSIINKLIELKNIRNTIAHGKNNILVLEEELDEYFVIILTFIISIEFKWANFEEITKKI